MAVWSYSQALCLNMIYFNNVFLFYQRCNKLEHWVHEWGYTQEILKARKIQRNELLEKERNHQGENKLTINLAYYHAFQKY